MSAAVTVAQTEDSTSPGKNEPKDGALYQQRMKAWYPILHPVWVIGGLFVLGIVFIPVGMKLKSISDGVVELSYLYDSGKGSNDEPCSILEPNENKKCSVTFMVDRDMEPPTLVYYQIENFYQNHRKYYHSRDDSQLLGSTFQDPNSIAAKDCEPLNKLKNKENKDIKLNPCGLIANTLFNDVFTLTGGNNTDGETLVMLEEGIAWESDVQFKFKQPNGFKSEKCDSCDECLCESDWCGTSNTPYKDSDGTCWKYYYPDDDNTQYLYETYPMVVSPIEGVMNEHFIVWMRNAALPKFRKLYGFIDKKISKGTELTFEINSNWMVNRFKGSKTLVLSTTSMFGGRNPALGNYFIGVGIFCLVCGSLFGLKHYFKPRKLGDIKYLKYKEE